MFQLVCTLPGDVVVYGDTYHLYVFREHAWRGMRDAPAMVEDTVSCFSNIVVRMGETWDSWGEEKGVSDISTVFQYWVESPEGVYCLAETDAWRYDERVSVLPYREHIPADVDKVRCVFRLALEEGSPLATMHSSEAHFTVGLEQRPLEATVLLTLDGAEAQIWPSLTLAGGVRKDHYLSRGDLYLPLVLHIHGRPAYFLAVPPRSPFAGRASDVPSTVRLLLRSVLKVFQYDLEDCIFESRPDRGSKRSTLWCTLVLRGRTVPHQLLRTLVWEAETQGLASFRNRLMHLEMQSSREVLVGTSEGFYGGVVYKYPNVLLLSIRLRLWAEAFASDPALRAWLFATPLDARHEVTAAISGSVRE